MQLTSGSRAQEAANNCCTCEENVMTGLIQCLHRRVIHWQLRSLQSQEKSIIEARKCALARLVEVRRERGIKEIELWLSHAGDANNGTA
jgi:hypothetical protein